MASPSNVLMARFDGVPAIVGSDSRAAFEANLDRAAIELAKVEAKHPDLMLGDDFWGDEDRTYSFRPYVVKDGILQIPIKGVLLHNFPYAFGDWATGYEYIRKAFERGWGDDRVRGIALVIDSPGGEVAGNFDLVDRMYNLMQEDEAKPVRAYAMEAAYSAAYSIASVANSITVSRTGGVGSIGVVTAHLDISEAMKERGWKITFIHAGDHKVDGNAYQPLPPEVKARIQKRIDSLYAVFVSTVARNRSMPEESIRATQALTYTAEDALTVKLADSIGTLDDALTTFAVDLEQENEQMAGNDNKVTAEDQAAALATATATGKSEGVKEGATAERTRINAIISSDEGKKRPKAALSLAMKSGVSAEDASAILADMNEETAPVVEKKDDEQANGGGQLADAMKKSQQPNLSTVEKKDGDQDDEMARVDAAFGYAGRSKTAA